MENAKTTGRVLKILRIASGYTIKQAGERAQVSSPHLTSLEKGTKQFSFQVANKLCRIYNLSSIQLMSLVEYYDGVDGDEFEKYQYTLAKALEMLLNKSNKSQVSKSTSSVLKIARHANQITLEETGMISGVNAICISGMERGQKANLTAENIARLARAYNLTVTQIEELANYYEGLEGNTERKFRLTLIKTLQFIENNLNK